MTPIAEPTDERSYAERIGRQERELHRAIPFYLLVPVAGWALYRAFGVEMRWGAAGLGALGWWLALLLRAPLAPLAKRLGEERGKTLIVSASGPLEEGVRLAFLALAGAGLGLPWALSLGWGWASIEVAFAVVNGLVVARILKRDDETARQARELLESQGLLRDAAPWWGVLERVFASALHLGFTLWIFAAPWLVLPAAAAHSATNLAVGRLSRRLPVMIGALAAVGSAALAVGLALTLG